MQIKSRRQSKEEAACHNLAQQHKKASSQAASSFEAASPWRALGIGTQISPNYAPQPLSNDGSSPSATASIAVGSCSCEESGALCALSPCPLHPPQGFTADEEHFLGCRVAGQGTKLKVLPAQPKHGTRVNAIPFSGMHERQASCTRPLLPLIGWPRLEPAETLPEIALQISALARASHAKQLRTWSAGA